MKSKRLLIILSIVVVLLLIPFIAMQFTSEVNWSTPDFVVAGVLLVGLGLIIELIARKKKSFRSRFALFSMAIIVFILIWAELAVGIFGSPLAGS